MTLTFSVFEKILNNFNLPNNEKWAVAVSGGADSLCLTLLLSEYCQKNNISLTAVTVNHNIRKESMTEAETVHQFLTEQGICHTTLHNKRIIGATSVEADAREIRYQLMINFCKRENISTLFIAHQAEDQAETFLSRLARGSGVDGLSAIRPISKREGVYLVRPLLDISKKEIETYLKKRDVQWINDPMNQDETYERVKWRHFLPLLEEKGILLKSMICSVKRLERSQQALQEMTNTFLNSSVQYYDEGYALIDTASFQRLPEEIKIRVLMSVLKTVGQTGNFISLELVERAVLSFPKKMTLAHCVLIPHKKGLFVVKEAHRMEQKKVISPNKWIMWDRFMILSDCAGVVCANPPLKRKKNIPYLVQCSFPCFKTEKELENNQDIRYKDTLKPNVRIKFIKES